MLFKVCSVVLIALMHCFIECDSPKVVVIGAGVAGLTTALRLHQKNSDVEIFEAKSRVGGRILSVNINEDIVELGGQNLLDGGEHENLSALCKEFDLECTHGSMSISPYFLDGDELISIPGLILQKKFNPEALHGELTEIAHRSKNMRDVLNALFDPSDTLYKSISLYLASYEGAVVDGLSTYYINTLYYILLGGISSSHQNHERGYEYTTIKGGNSVLMEKMAQTLGNRIHLNMPLVAVTKSEKGSYLVTFKNGKVVEADILVLAIPCSTFCDISFGDNVISSERLSLINNVQYGTNARIVAPHMGGTRTKPLYYTNERVGTWFNDRFTTFNIYCTGKTSYFTNDTIKDVYMNEYSLLLKAYGADCLSKKIPVAYDESKTFYDGPVGHSWPNDPYARGSYAFIAPGQETIFTETQKIGGELVKKLFAPIDNLHFAGEHASILFDVMGTMEAACESGERTARMIVKLCA